MLLHIKYLTSNSKARSFLRAKWKNVFECTWIRKTIKSMLWVFVKWSALFSGENIWIDKKEVVNLGVDSKTDLSSGIKAIAYKDWKQVASCYMFSLYYALKRKRASVTVGLCLPTEMYASKDVFFISHWESVRKRASFRSYPMPTPAMAGFLQATATEKNPGAG